MFTKQNDCEVKTMPWILIIILSCMFAIYGLGLLDKDATNKKIFNAQICLLIVQAIAWVVYIANKIKLG